MWCGVVCAVGVFGVVLCGVGVVRCGVRGVVLCGVCVVRCGVGVWCVCMCVWCGAVYARSSGNVSQDSVTAAML